VENCGAKNGGKPNTHLSWLHPDGAIKPDHFAIQHRIFNNVLG